MRTRSKRFLAIACLALLVPALGQSAVAASPFPQDSATEADEPAQDPSELSEPVEAVSVDPAETDTEIRNRLVSIFAASGWFENLEVSVSAGIVTMSGTSASPDERDWATSVARKTESVVGVANNMRVIEPIDWSLAPAWESLRTLWSSTIRRMPLLLVGLCIFALSLGLGGLLKRALRPLLKRKFENALLVQVMGTLTVVLCALVGLYLFMQVSGLSRLAATILGGTGVFGLIVGVAFRDIAENFLASVLISAKRPFRLGDLISVGDLQGYVLSVTTRGTLLMTADGHHIHIPNSTVYKETVTNYSANPKRRYDFVLGIDYEDTVESAQATCLEVLLSHEHVLSDPEPLVLVDELGASSVNLRVLYWLDATRKSPAKVQSSVLRLMKIAVTEAGLTMPDDAREIVFPNGVPVHQMDAPPLAMKKPAPQTEVSTEVTAEGGDESDSELAHRQAKASEDLNMGEDLVGSSNK